MNVRFKGTIWRYPGVGGWHFLTLNKTVSARIRGLSGGKARGFGSIRAKAKVGKVEWNTSIFPTKEGDYLLPIKANIRKATGKTEGETLTVVLTLFLQ